MTEESGVGPVSRRSFVAAAVSVGGSLGLSACLGTERDPDLPRGPTDLSTLPERQHAWNDVLSTDEAGNVVAPRHRLVLLLDLTTDGVPAEDTRERMRRTFDVLDRAYHRSNDGLLFTVSYSSQYFDRFDGSLPETVEDAARHQP